MLISLTQSIKNPSFTALTLPEPALFGSFRSLIFILAFSNYTFLAKGRKTGKIFEKFFLIVIAVNFTSTKIKS